MPYNADDFKPKGIVKELPASISYNTAHTARAAAIYQYTDASGRHYDKPVAINPADQADHTFRFDGGSLTTWSATTNLATAMDKWEQFIPVTFNATTASTALITVSAVRNLESWNKTKGVWENNSGVAHTFDSDGNGVYEKVEILLDLQETANSDPGKRGFQTILHELGHALGLDHPFDESNPFDPSTGYSWDNTLMAYLEGSVLKSSTATYAITPMIWDVKYSQENPYIPLAYNSTSTLYSFADNANVKLTGDNYAWTLYESGTGKDTIDASGAPEGSWAKIDLRGGVDADGTPRFSEINKKITGQLNPSTEYFSIAFDSRNASGVVDIEVAKGGSGNDTLIGGYVGNTLVGGAGGDKLYDTSLNANVDILYGDAESTVATTITGGAGDTLWGGLGDKLYGGQGADEMWLNGSTGYYFNDGTNPAEKIVALSGDNRIDWVSAPGSLAILSNLTVAVHPSGASVALTINGSGASSPRFDDSCILRVGNVRIEGDFFNGVYNDTDGYTYFALGNGWKAAFDWGGKFKLLDDTGRVVLSSYDWSNGNFGLELHDSSQSGTSDTLPAIGALPDDYSFINDYLEKAKPGTAAADTIYGGQLAETLFGFDGNDVAYGGNGTDRLELGKGSNTASGGGDRDTFVIAADTVAAVDTITDFNPGMGEVIDLSALGSNLVLNITQTGADASFTIGNRTVVLKNVSASTLTASNFVSVASLKVTVVPTTGNDNITGTSGADTIDALAGNDTISGLGGNDSLVGNSGDDVLIGGAGADTLSGGNGSDTASYAGSAAVNVNLATGAASGGHAAGDVFSSIENLIGSSNADTLAGNTSSNSILGGGGNDTILGDSGNDTLDGEAGNDSIDGGSGNDLIYGGTGSDWMIGGTGTDTLDYSRSTAAVTLSLLAGTASGGYAAGDTISGAEYVIGSNYNDSITGDAGNNSLIGGFGNDTLRGDAGRDTIDGGDGNDSLYGGTDNDKLTDLLGNNKLFGEAGNDTLTGGAGADSLDGGDGDDVLEGGAGADTLVGGLGIDTLTYDNATAAVNVNLKAGTGAGAEAAGDKPSGIEKLIGSDFNDTLTGGTAAETIDGGNGNNTINGDAGADSLKGGSGLDTMNGGAGNDTLDGGSGNDSLRGGADADSIDGGSGNDLLFGDAGADTLDGGSGVDTMTGGTEADLYYFASSDTGLGTAADHIVGFSRTQGDKIEFNMSGISASSFVGTGAFTSGGVKEFGYTKTTINGANATVIRIDYDNNGATDREIVLDGIHIDLTASDFLY